MPAIRTEVQILTFGRLRGYWNSGDIAQEVWLEIITNRLGFRGLRTPEQFMGRVRRIAKSKILDEHNRLSDLMVSADPNSSEALSIKYNTGQSPSSIDY